MADINQINLKKRKRSNLFQKKRNIFVETKKNAIHNLKHFEDENLNSSSTVIYRVYIQSYSDFETITLTSQNLSYAGLFPLLAQRSMIIS